MEKSKAFQNRPMYRGKGFKDGNLPKPKKKKQSKKPAVNKYDTDGDCDKSSMKNSSDHCASHLVPDPKSQPDVENVGPQQDSADQNNMSEVDESVIKEVNHLRRRILNIQESIQLSPSLAKPTIWKEKCLNAIHNCVNEWRNIVAYHGRIKMIQVAPNPDQNKDEEYQTDEIEQEGVEKEYPMHPDNELSKSTALRVFGLVQMAMQSGPLKGSNPGYFKRCGAEVASMAKDFLIKCVSDSEGVDLGDIERDLRFTTKQKEMIEKWITNAEKAITANKPPSKSAMKLQTIVKSGKKQKHSKGNKRQ